MRLGRAIGLAIGSLTMIVASSLGARENLDEGKTAVQLYASNCVTCHKSPRSVTRATDLFGLESFLREHYTASRDSAAKLAAYLKGLEKLSAGHTHRDAATHGKQGKRLEPTGIKSDEDELRPPVDIPQPKKSKPNRP